MSAEFPRQEYIKMSPDQVVGLIHSHGIEPEIGQAYLQYVFHKELLKQNKELLKQNGNLVKATWALVAVTALLAVVATFTR